jgi:trigger factor
VRVSKQTDELIVKVTTERLPQSQVRLQIEVEPERLERAMDQAYRRVVHRARIPGFRPGKAPRPMVERYLGRETLLQEALDRLVPEVYEEALKQEGIDAIAQPELEIPQMEPPVLKLTVPVRPSIELGDYRDVRVEPEPVSVDEETIDQTIEQLRHRYATIEPVERPVQLGDLVRADVRVSTEDSTVFEEDDDEFRVMPEMTAGLPGLADGIVGMQRGEEREFIVEVPEDGAQKLLAGKTVTYFVRIHEVKEEKLPELNEEFTSQVGEGFANMEALRQRLRDDARARLEEAARDRDQRKALDALVAGATVEYPPVLLDREVENLLRDRMPPGDQRQAMQRYLSQVGKSEAEMKEELRPAASERLLRSLVLSKFADAEGIEVSPEDVDAEIERMAGEMGGSGSQFRELFGSESGRQALEGSLRTRRAYERLGEIASGAPLPESDNAGVDETESAAEPTAAPTQETPVNDSAGQAASGEAAEAAGDAGPREEPPTRITATVESEPAIPDALPETPAESQQTEP